MWRRMRAMQCLSKDVILRSLATKDLLSFGSKNAEKADSSPSAQNDM